ncbi:hypothetical protein K7432_008088 [Basidiobolus ranarum]|uniref:HMG box domain-containing protein n=1 Tax=Basidiobolus ranarum TaxID=34480 RepID=A0ABR2VZ55_9FUNG
MQNYSYCVVPQGYIPVLIPHCHYQELQSQAVNIIPTPKCEITAATTSQSNSPRSSTHIEEDTETVKRILKPPRPLNPFLLFRKDVQASVFAQNPGISNSEVSKVIGQMWKDAPFDVKERYQLSAEDKKRIHKEMYPNYKYAPERSNKRKNSKKSTQVRGTPVSNCKQDQQTPQKSTYALQYSENPQLSINGTTGQNSKFEIIAPLPSDENVLTSELLNLTSSITQGGYCDHQLSMYPYNTTLLDTGLWPLSTNLTTTSQFSQSTPSSVDQSWSGETSYQNDNTDNFEM